jgi:hypothetical protein
MYPCMLFRYYDDLLKFVDTLLGCSSNQSYGKMKDFFFQKQKQTEKNIDADFQLDGKSERR